MTNLLIDKILGLYNDDLPFCYNNIETYQSSNPGLINGAVGIALALLGTITSSENEWDSAFLIS